MSWPSVALAEVATIERNGIPPEEIRDGTEYLGLEHIKSGGEILGKEIVANGDLASTKFTFGPQHVLYGKLRPYLGKIALPDFEGVCSTDILPVMPGSKLDRNYLAYFLRQPTMIDYASRRSTGANLPRLNPKALAEFSVPLPPLEEQKRIAGILDQADALRRLRARALDKLNTLGQAIFYEMFGDVVSNSMCWDEGAVLGDVSEIVSGITKGRKTNGKSLREVPYLAVSNVQDHHLKMEIVKTIEATESEIERFQLQRGDLLLTEGGDPDKLGRGTLWNNELDECIHQNHVFRVRLTSSGIKPSFLNWIVGSQRGKNYFFRSSKQTTGIASINKTQLKEFPLLLPPISVQEEFENRLRHLKAVSGTFGAASEQGIALFASLQHRAFRGEL